MFSGGLETKPVRLYLWMARKIKLLSSYGPERKRNLFPAQNVGPFTGKQQIPILRKEISRTNLSGRGMEE